MSTNQLSRAPQFDLLSSNGHLLSDEELATNVVEVLRTTGYRELFELDVRVDGHNIFLRGYVPSYFMKQKAEHLVASIHRDAQVISQIAVRRG